MDIAQQNSQVLEKVMSQAFQKAPQQVKQIFKSIKEQDGSFNWEKLDFQKLGFNVKKTQVNFCQKKIQIGNKYYVCQTCSNYSTQSIYLLCQQCYDIQKHVNHPVSETQVLSQSQATCDCGIVERLEKSSFCNQHSAYSVQFECQINGEESERFQKCFGSIFQIGMIQEDTNIFFQQICQYLQKLNENSIYYNRLTFRLISQQCCQRFQGEKYVQFLSKFLLQNSFLAMWVCGDLKTRKQLTKLVCQFIDQDQSQDLQYSPFQEDCILSMMNLTTIQALINQGFYHEIFHGLLKRIQICFSKKKYDFNPIYQKIITSQLSQLKKFDSKLIKKLTKLVKSMDQSQLMELVKKVVSVFPDSESIKKYLRGQESEQENPWAKFQLIQNKGQQNLQNLPLDAHQLLKLFVDLSSSLIALKGLDKKNFKKTLMQSGVPEQKLEHILYWVAACSKGLFYTMNNQTNQLQKQIKLIGILVIILSSTNQQQLLQKVQSSLFGDRDQQQGIQKIGRMVQKFYFVISILLLSDIWMMIKRKKMPQHQGLKNNENSEHLLQFLKNWLRSFLYSKKVVSQQELIDLKIKGILDFKGIGSILDQLCTFKSSDGVFNYSSAKVYKNLVNEFPLIPNRDDFDSIYSTQITYADKIPMQQGSIGQNLIELFLSTKTLLQLFRDEWKNYLSNQQKDTNYKYAYLYMFFLVVYNSLTKGQNVEVKEELQIYRKNENLLNDFTQNEEEIKAIKKLLGIDEIVPIKPEQTDQKPNQLKAKGQQKKKKLAQKFEKKRLLFLDRIPSFKSQSANQEQQICILCHQKKKIDNEIVYIGAINKKTMCDALFGNDNKTNTLMNTCFHALHINCYINVQKQNSDQSFNCPLCQAYCNFIIPIKYDVNAKRLNKIVENVKIVLMISVFKIYDPEDFFMVIFRHLVESKGLNSLIYEPLYSQKLKINTKRDDFLQQLMMDKYLSADKQERQEYLKCISTFIEQLSTCTNQWVKNVQLLFAESLLTIITLRESNQQVKLLQHIKLNLKSEQYAIVLEQFLHIMEEQFELPFDQAETINQKSISLSLPEVKLPLTVPECIQKYSKAMCEKCSGKLMSMLCLFCGKTFCYECKDNHEQEKHHQHKFYFNLDDMSIYSRNQRQNTIDCVYLNQFKVSYSERGNYEEGTFAEDQFELNEKFLVKKVCNFFAN